ncbi:MAG: hypothetical protein IT406_01550 [Candidatus Yanofskybacteria bacterium]|nr:hypothetical protein [Candidatus Yanofskybacteria bacterium]
MAIRRPLFFLHAVGAALFVVGAVSAVAWQRENLLFARSSASGERLVIECSGDAACPAGMYCGAEGVCRDPFACPAFLDARWRNGTDMTAGGVFSEIRNGKYLSLVQPASLWGRYVRRYWTLRATGGPAGTHSYERVVLKRFSEPMNALAGHLRVNLSRVQHYFSCTGCLASSPIMLLGGYNSALWPADGTWVRDLTVGATQQIVPVGVTPTPYPMLGGVAYQHNNFGVGNPSLFPLSQPQTWPDRMVDIQWYITPGGDMYMRVDGQQWVKTSIPSSVVPPKERHLYGVALGWVSSSSGGSVDIEQLQLYPLSCKTASDRE